MITKLSYILMVGFILYTSVAYAHGGLNLSWDSPADVSFFIAGLTLQYAPYLIVGVLVVYGLSMFFNKKLPVTLIIWPISIIGLICFLAVFFFVGIIVYKFLFYKLIINLAKFGLLFY